MAAKLKQYAQTIYNHKKKSIFALVVGYYGVSWLRESNKDARIRSYYAKEARSFGDMPIGAEDRPRRVTVLINPLANTGKASDNFHKTALPLLNLAGLDVTVIKSKDAGELESLAAVLDSTEADVVYVVGGDGSISRVLTGIYGPKGASRTDKTLPIGVFPGGVENRGLRGLLPALFECDNDVARFCECAMSVIEDQKRPIYPLSCEITTSGEDGQETSEKLVTLDNVAGGWFEHCEHKKQKFWYFGGLKTRFTYLFEMLKATFGNSPSPLLLNIDYKEACTGCNRCRQTVQTTAAPVEWRWWHALTGSPRYNAKTEAEFSKDYSKIVNPNCGSRHTARVQGTDVQIINKQVQDGSQIELNAGGSSLGRLGVISEGWARTEKETRQPSKADFYDTHLVANSMNIRFDNAKDSVSGNENEPLQQILVVGGERNEVDTEKSAIRIAPVQRPVQMFLPSSIRVNLETI